MGNNKAEKKNGISKTAESRMADHNSFAPGERDKERNYGLDVLRCVAMIMVVILHFLDKGGLLRALSDEGSFTAKDVTAWLLEALCIVAVNLYMLMSGYLLYQGRFKLSRLLGLVGKVWLYSVMVGFIGIALGTPAEPVDTYFKLRLLFPISMNTYWFMTAYIFFYMLVPILGIAARAMTRTQMKVMLGCLIFFHVIIKSITPAQLTVDASGMDAMWYVVLFFASVYIRRFCSKNVTEVVQSNGTVAERSNVTDTGGLNETLAEHSNGLSGNSITYVLLYVVAALLIFGEAMALRTVYIKTGSLSYILNISYAYNHVLVLLASILLFIAFLKAKIPSGIGKVFAFLGKYSLGVYLLHENLSVRYAWEPLLGSGRAVSPMGVIGTAALAGVVVFISGVIADLIGTKIAGFMLDLIKKAPVFKKIALAVSKADSAFDGALND